MRPVEPRSSKQVDSPSVQTRVQAIAVVLDLVQPLFTHRCLVYKARELRLDPFWVFGKFGVPLANTSIELFNFGGDLLTVREMQGMRCLEYDQQRSGCTRLSRAGDPRAYHVEAFLQLYTGCQKPDQAAISIETRAATQQP